MTEEPEIERITEKEISVTFHYKVERVIDRKYKDQYYILYVTIDEGNGKIMKFDKELGNDPDVDELLKELRRINNFYGFAYSNEKLMEGLKEEVLKRIAMLIWKA